MYSCTFCTYVHTCVAHGMHDMQPSCSNPQANAEVLLYSCSNCRRAPNSRSCPDNASRIGKLWHVASLSFAANPVRAHREWAGVIDRVNLPELEVPQTASPGVGAIIRCLHRDFHPSNDHGRYAHSPAVASLSATLLYIVVASLGHVSGSPQCYCRAHCTMAHPQ